MPQTNDHDAPKSPLQEGVERLALGIALFTAELGLDYCNPAAAEQCRLPAERLRDGLALEELLREAVGAAAATSVDACLTRARRGEPFRFEIEHPDGKTVEIATQPLAGGALLATFTDTTRLRSVTRSLNESEERYQELVNLAPVLICVHSDGILRYINPAGARMLGALRPAQLTGRRIDTLVHPDCHDDLRARLTKLERDTGSLPRMEHRYLRLDGSEIDVEVMVRPFRHRGRIAFLTVAREITERRRAEHQLRAILDASPNGVAVINLRGEVRFCNPAFQQLFGLDGEPTVGPFKHLLAHPEQFEGIKQRLLREEAIRGQELDLKRASGAAFCALLSAKRMEFEAEPAIFFWIVDISEQKSIRQRLAQLAHYDELTELPNRRLFLDQTQRAIALAKRTGKRCALLYFDLDGFKPINDTLGHEAGDRLLREVAARARGQLRASDLVARIGGDEFAALLMDIREPPDAEAIAAKLAAVIAQPYELSGRPATISASFGVACFPGDAATAEALIAQADCAMYTAKQAGKACVRSAAQTGPR